MKKILLALTLFSSVCFGQSKKEQIEILQTRVDSIKTTLSETKVKLDKAYKINDSNKEKINALESKYSDIQAEKENISQQNALLQEKYDKLHSKLETAEKNLSVIGDTISAMRKKIESLNKSLQPSVYLTYKISQFDKGQDARNLSNDEIKISLYINDLIIDTYTDYGSGEYSKENMSLYLASDMSQKTYSISIINEHQIAVYYILFFDGEERKIWNRTYSMLKDNNWSESVCEGDCE